MEGASQQQEQQQRQQCAPTVEATTVLRDAAAAFSWWSLVSAILSRPPLSIAKVAARAARAAQDMVIFYRNVCKIGKGS